MIRKRYYLLFLSMAVFFFSGIFLSGCNRAEDQPVAAVKVDCAALLDSRCQVCHTLARICQTLEKKSQGKWESTIKTMVGRGAKLDSDEQRGLAACLGQRTDGVEELCRDYH